MPKIIIAGGGIAGLEALIALRSHLDPSVEIDVLEGNTDLVERQRSVTEPFAGPAPRRFDLARIVAEQDGHLRPDRLSSIDPHERRVRTVRGDTLSYDALLIAVGARTDIAIPGALTFAGPRDVAAMRRLLDQLESGFIESVAFAVPASVAWVLPLYELALMTAEHLRTRGMEGVSLTVVTPEHNPLEAFGPRIASHIYGLLSDRAIAVRADTVPLRTGAGGLQIAHGFPVQVHSVVSLPRLGGPFLAGLPHDEDGFLPTDAYGAVPGVDAVWAAGDNTTFPLKQGGLAAQQADVCAASIAAQLGADVTPSPFRPVLRGLLLDPKGQRFLDERRGDVPTTPLWWPPTKVAATHLGRYLGTATTPAPEEAGDVDVVELLVTLGARHAALGERTLALRCFDAAQQVLGELPPAVAARRDELATSRRAPSGSR